MIKTSWESNYKGRRKIIGVMGSKTPYPKLTDPLGQLIAEMGYHLLTGAGGGIMEDVSKSFATSQNRSGLVFGIVRADPNLVKEDMVSQLRVYAPNSLNKWIEVPIYTHLRKSDKSWDSRNHINVLTSDVVVALPGKGGTESEVELALEYHVPTIFFLDDGQINGHTATHFTGKYPKSPAEIAETLEEVKTAIQIFLP